MNTSSSKRNRRKRQPERFTVTLHYEPGERVDLRPLADVLLLLSFDPALDKALKVAHNFNTVQYAQVARRRTLEALADDLRAKLHTLDDRLSRV
jgi:hypothetical protein